MTRIARAPRFGVVLPTRRLVFSSGGNRDLLGQTARRDIIEMVDAAEEAGFDYVCAGDSILAKPRLESLITLSVAAGHAHRIRLMTTILIPVLRDPILLADQVATLDHLAEGRLELGIGVGEPTDIVRKEFGDLGIDFGTRGRRSDELLRLLKRLWAEDHITHSGEFYRFEDISVDPKPFQRPHPPLLIGAGHFNFEKQKVEGPFRRVAELGDGWISTLITPEERRQAWQLIGDEAQKIGRDPATIDRVCFLSINMRPTREQAIEEMRGFLSQYLGGSFEQHFAGASEIDRWGAFGTPDDCAALVQAHVEAGADTVIFRLPREDQITQLRDIAEHLLPRLR